MRKVLYILGQLDDHDIDWLAHVGRQRQLKAGDVLIEEGREQSDLFIVLDGHVEVTVSGIGHVASLGSGELLGEMSFVDKAPASATVRAAEATSVLALRKTAIDERLNTNAGFAGRFYKALAIFLADRLRGTAARQRTGEVLKSNLIEEDELDDSVLDNISMAGLRFQQMLKTLRETQSH